MMVTRGLLFTGALCAALLGCAAPEVKSGARLPCNPGSCDIPVHVAPNCVITSPRADDIIDVSGTVNIIWKIDPDSHAFMFPPEGDPRPGVWIKSPDPQSQFAPARLGDWIFRQHDRNTDNPKGTYRYGIRVVNKATGAACPDLDPFIVNH